MIPDLAQIESGRVAALVEAVPLSKLPPERVSRAGRAAGNDARQGEPAPLERLHYVDADRTRLRQVLINLCTTPSSTTSQRQHGYRRLRHHPCEFRSASAYAIQG